MPDYLALVFRWLHIIPALVMVGGIIFMRCCLVSSNPDQASFFDSQEQVQKNWARLVMASTLLLLISGLYNSAMKAMGYELSMTYNVLLLIKIVLALVVFYLLAVLSGRSERAKRFRRNETHWLNVLVVLMLLIVLIGGYMKIGSTDFEKKVRDQSQVPTAEMDENVDSLAARSFGLPAQLPMVDAKSMIYSAGKSLIS